MPFLGLLTYRASRTALRAHSYNACQSALCYESQELADRSVQAKAVSERPWLGVGSLRSFADYSRLPDPSPRCLSVPRILRASPSRYTNKGPERGLAHAICPTRKFCTYTRQRQCLRSWHSPPLWLNEPDVSPRSWCANRVIRSDL